MQLSNAPSKIVLPFANTGGKRTIPVASQIGITAGAASFTDGFPPLTYTPVASGGVPVSPLDMNGILNEISAPALWACAGAGFPYDPVFSAAVGGYPQGARVMRSDGAGYWLCTADNNTTNPESSPVGWVPDATNGITAVTLAGANVTLTPLQYGKPIIVLSGTLTTNVNLILPAIIYQWLVVNNCSGAFTVTCKTAAGTGTVVLQSLASGVYADGTNIYAGGGGNAIETLTGDVTAAGPGAATATLAASGVTAGSYTGATITVDAKGRVTAASTGFTSGSNANGWWEKTPTGHIHQWGSVTVNIGVPYGTATLPIPFVSSFDSVLINSQYAIGNSSLLTPNNLPIPASAPHIGSLSQYDWHFESNVSDPFAGNLVFSFVADGY